MTDTQAAAAANTPTPAADSASQAPTIPTDRAGLEARAAELTAFHSAAPQEFQYSPSGPAGPTRATELLVIRKALAALDADKAPVADDVVDADTVADDAGEVDAAPAGEVDAEPLEVNLDIPDSAEDYISTDAVGEDHWSRQDPLAAKYAEFLAEAGMPQAAYDAGIKYIERIRDDRLAADKTERAAAKSRLKPDEIQSITATLRDAGDFGALLRSARGPDGSLIITHPAFKGILSLGSKAPSAAAPNLSADEARHQELTRIMHADIDKYRYERTGRRNPDGTWQTLADERLEVARRLDAAKKRA